MKFSQIIQKRRVEKRYSIRRLAEILEVSPGYLSRIESEQVPPPAAALIKRMAELLDLNADKLLASADKVSDDLLEIIKNDPINMAEIIRSASNSAAASYGVKTKDERSK
jgi:transcriptional regulator with XRE-family HTH domain